MYVYSFFNYTEKVESLPKDKKPLLKKMFNKIDSFGNLALYGAQMCMQERLLNSQSSIYLASSNGNMNTTIKVMDAIFAQNSPPMPFQFLNSVNASQLFYLSKLFLHEGKSLFVDRFESAIVQAYVDSKYNRDILLGEVNEVIEDIDIRKKRLGKEYAFESSRWLLLSSYLENQHPVAHISNLSFESQNREDAVSLFFDFLDSDKVGNIHYFQGESLSFCVEKLKS